VSDGPAKERTTRARREQIRVRVDKLRQSRQRSALGVPEIAGLAGSAIMLLAVVFVYLSFYSPAESRLVTAQLERARLRQKLSTLQKDIDLQGTAQDSISKISQSLESFEDARLSGRDEGRITLYNVLIRLIRSNNLRNTSGPVYNSLEAKGSSASQTASGSTVNTRWQSLYPGIGVTVTVEGQYANLRRFVRDIESSSQFIVINAVELERASDTDTATSGVTSKTGPSLVSLRLDMAAYFRRDAGEVRGEEPVNATP
jgi:hypothetical protein